MEKKLVSLEGKHETCSKALEAGNAAIMLKHQVTAFGISQNICPVLAHLARFCDFALLKAPTYAMCLQEQSNIFIPEFGNPSPRQNKDILLLCKDCVAIVCLYHQSLPHIIKSEVRGPAARKELGKELTMSKTLQGLCRTLQTQNGELSRHLELKLSEEQETSKQSENLQQAISDITTR